MSNARFGLRTLASGEVRTLSRRGILPFIGDTFFTDTFGVPAMAFSLRKLEPNATNCIRVRRGSDNAEQDFGFVNSLPNSPLDVAAVEAFVGAGNDGFVVTWYNQGSLGDATQSTGANQPRIVSSGVIDDLNSLPVVRNPTNNVERFLNTSISTLQALPVTAIFAGKITQKANNAFGNPGWHLGGTGGIGGARYELYSEDNGIIAFRRTGASMIQSAFNNDPFIQQGIFRTGGLEGRFNGVDNTGVAYSGAEYGVTSNFTIGGGGGGSSFQVGLDAYEYIIYYSDKYNDREAIETDIDNYYGIL